MKEITVIIGCYCTVPIEFETDAETIYDLSSEERDEIFEQALQEYNPSLEYDYYLEEIESMEEVD